MERTERGRAARTEGGGRVDTDRDHGCNSENLFNSHSNLYIVAKSALFKNKLPIQYIRQRLAKYAYLLL